MQIQQQQQQQPGLGRVMAEGFAFGVGSAAAHAAVGNIYYFSLQILPIF